MRSVVPFPPHFILWSAASGRGDHRDRSQLMVCLKLPPESSWPPYRDLT